MLPALLLNAVFLLAADPSFDYDRSLPLDIKVVSTTRKEGLDIRDITFQNLKGGRTAAYLIVPEGRGKVAGALYVHWYEPEAANSNRTQFVDEAAALARRGLMSLLIETMWSDKTWFPKRKRSEDLANSVQQVKELRRALDVLLADSRVDPKRVAYIGHDFGAMFGAVMGSVESKRIAAWALQAGTVSFSDWYLFGQPKLEGAERQRFIDELAPLDPVRYIGKAAPAPVLFQFGRTDFYVPEPKAKQFFDAAGEPKKILWYEAGHALNHQARVDREKWLGEKLKLRTLQ